MLDMKSQSKIGFLNFRKSATKFMEMLLLEKPYIKMKNILN